MKKQLAQDLSLLVEVNDSHLARGAIPLAFPNSYPCILTGIPLLPAAIAAV